MIIDNINAAGDLALDLRVIISIRICGIFYTGYNYIIIETTSTCSIIYTSCGPGL